MPVFPTLLGDGVVAGGVGAAEVAGLAGTGLGYTGIHGGKSRISFLRR